jgi:REP element-mobilizing transposase RayT
LQLLSSTALAWHSAPSAPVSESAGASPQVVIPEHVHLLISEPQEKDPSVVMQALKLGFARRVLAERRHSHRSQANLFEHAAQHVWQKRFYDFNVWTARKRVEKLRYMHRNPVQRGLVASPELWRWSSPQPESEVYSGGRCGQATSRKPREVAHP